MTAEILAWNRESPYDLSPEVLRQKTAELLYERPPQGNAPEVYYKLEGADPYADIARTVERQVFEDAFGNTTDKMEGAYGPYEYQSMFFLAVDRTGDEPVPSGTLRIIKNGPRGFMTLNDLAEKNGIEAGRRAEFIEAVRAYHNISDLDECWDIGTVAVLDQYRLDHGHLTSVQLYRGMHVAGMTADVKHYFSMIDVDAHRILVRMLGIPFEPLAGSGPVEYLDSAETYPVYGSTEEFLKSANRKKLEVEERLKGRAAGAIFMRAFDILVDGGGDEAYQFAINNETLKLE